VKTGDSAAAGFSAYRKRTKERKGRSTKKSNRVGAGRHAGVKEGVWRWAAGIGEDAVAVRQRNGEK